MCSSLFVFVLGLDHNLQHMSPSPEQLNEIQKFGSKVDDLVHKYDFDVYCEESKHGLVSLLQKHAAVCGKQYINVEMSPEFRVARGIPDAYRASPEQYSEEQCQAWDKAREGHMVDQIVGYLERLGLSRAKILLLCGEAHREPLVELLHSRGFEADGESGIEDIDLTVFDAAGIYQRSLSG